MAAGQALSLKHPVVDWHLNTGSAADLEQSVKPVMDLTEEQLLAFVPPYGYAQYCECPNCYGGVEGNGVLLWDIKQPGELRCRFCKTLVYPNPAYPEDRTLSGVNALGEKVTFPYYFDEKHQVPHFFSTHLWLGKRAWLLGQVDALARAYALTGKEPYARRVAVVLDKLAAVYPHYPVMQNLPRRYVFRESQQPPYAWDSGRWNFFHNEVPLEVIPAYDLVYASAAFDKLSAERGYDVREKVERDFLRASTEAAMAYTDYISNIIGYSPRSAALLGRVMNEPRFVHWAFGWMAANVDRGFFRDGMWSESPSYHYMTIGGLESCFDAVRGYSDPAGYKDPVDGTRYDNLDPVKQLVLWGKCVNAPEAIGMPNGCSACVHDSWYYERRTDPREATLSTILPGFGHASLGRGRGPNQLQAQLHFSGAYGHAHYDSLNLALWAHDREMLPDIGYTWTQMRCLTTSTVAHNTVVVDRRNQDGGGSDGNLLLYCPGDRDPEGLELAAVEAEGRAAYRSVKDLDRYRRLVVTVPLSAAEAYVVDVFRLRGGRLHDWTLNGDADRDSLATCSAALSGKRETMLEPGEQWVEPTTESASFPPYGMLRDMARGETSGDLQVDYAYPADDATRGLRVRLFSEPGEVWLGRCPSVRRMGVGTRGDMRKAYDFWMPKLLVRRTGEGPLESTFAAVYEPWSGRPLLGEVRRLKVTPDDNRVVAVQVRHGAATDTILSTLDEAPYPERVTETGLKLRGRLGIVREEEGKVVGVWLFEGTSFAGKGWGLQGAVDALTGEVSGATRKAAGDPLDALLTTADLPAGDALHGRWLILTTAGGVTAGHEIDRVEKRAGETAIVLADDPALKIDAAGAQEVYFPGRKLGGAAHLPDPGGRLGPAHARRDLPGEPHGAHRGVAAEVSGSLPRPFVSLYTACRQGMREGGLGLRRALPRLWRVFLQPLGEPCRQRRGPTRLGIDDDLVALGAGHGLDRAVNLGQREAVRDRQPRVHEAALEQAQRLLHRQGVGAEAGVHAGLEEMGQPAVEFERLVSRDPKDVPAGAAAQEGDHEPDRLNGPSGFDDEVGTVGEDVVDGLSGVAGGRVHAVGGAEAAGGGEGVLAHIDRDEPPGPRGLRHHQTVHADPPRADHDDVVADLHLRVLDEALPGAADRLGLTGGVEVQAARLGVERLGLGDHVLGEGPRARVGRPVSPPSCRPARSSASARSGSAGSGRRTRWAARRPHRPRRTPSRRGRRRRRCRPARGRGSAGR